MQRPARSSKIRAGPFELVCHVVRYCPYRFRQSLQLELEMIVAPGRRAGGFSTEVPFIPASSRLPRRPGRPRGRLQPREAARRLATRWPRVGRQPGGSRARAAGPAGR